MTVEDFNKRFDFNSDASGSIIGRGGFGVVYKAYDKVRHRFVAIKRCEVEQSSKFDLKREVEVANEIEPHPNILRYENIFRITEQYGTYDYAVMKYYAEGNLEDVMKKNVLSDEHKKQIIAGLLKGLIHIHQIPIIHRDFKTANILMEKSPTGEWKPLICDFGQSRLVDNDNSIITNNSQFALTPKYSAPEQLLGTKQLRTNADLWALGVIIYQMFKGKLPFTVEGSDKDWGRSERIRLLILQGDIPKDIVTLPEPYQEIVKKCLVSDPDKRVKNASTLLGLIEKHNSSSKENSDISGDITTVFPPPKPKPPTPRPKPLEDKKVLYTEQSEEEKEGSGKVLNYVLMAAIVIIVGVGVYFFLKNNDSQPVASMVAPNNTSDSTVNNNKPQQKKVNSITPPEVIPDKNDKTTAPVDSPLNESSIKKGNQVFAIQVITNEDCQIWIDGKKHGSLKAYESKKFTFSYPSSQDSYKVYIVTLKSYKDDEVTSNVGVNAGQTEIAEINF
ncbi:serine/threonine-protein kinase [Emticicia sp. 17c]|uniref:serine/threonine-protein kinase n=1 Tax=Emticicia sp. 17c TaxID=3127704 RepID=UPI00301DD912